MSKKKNDNGIIIVSIVVASIIVLLIIGGLVYSLGKSNGYERRNSELREYQLNLEKEDSRIALWEGDLVKRENQLNQTLLNISDYQDKKKDLEICQSKLSEPSEFNFIIPLYYSHTEIQMIIISIVLIFPLTLALFQIVIKDKDIKILINWVLIVILLFILIAIGVN
jgi:ABC-type uncharacterized transport system fused permease/ATPase subunit